MGKSIKDIINNIKSSIEKDKILKKLEDEHQKILFNSDNNELNKKQLIDKLNTLHDDLLVEYREHEKNKKFINFLSKQVPFNTSLWSILDYLKKEYFITEEIKQYIIQLVEDDIEKKLKEQRRSIHNKEWKDFIK